MFKHLVLWQFSPEVSPARRETLIRGLQKAEIGQNLLPDSGYHMILYTEFTNREAMEAYQNHPLHLAVKEEMKNTVCGRLAVDYQV